MKKFLIVFCCIALAVSAGLHIPCFTALATQSPTDGERPAYVDPEALLPTQQTTALDEKAPVIPGEDIPVTPNENEPVVPNEDKPVVPNEDKPVVPNEDKPVVPNEGEAVPPNEGEPVTPDANDSEKKADLLQKLDKLPGGRKAAAIIAAVAVLAIAIGVIVIVKLGEKRKVASAVVPCEKTFFVRSVGKALAGQEFVFLDEFRIGRNRALCELVLPMDAVGVGSVHCHIVCESGGVYLTDKDSCGGTYMADGTRLEPEKKYPLVNGSQFFVGNKNNAFIIYFNA